jgi:hypothetical protein
MKNIIKLLSITAALLVSFNASAHLLQYNLNLETTNVEGSAFGGISVGEIFHGSLAINTHILQDIVNTDGGFPTIILPLQDDNEAFNLSYIIPIGNYTYTEQTAGSFYSEFTVDDPVNVEGIVAFTMDVGDMSFNDFSVASLNNDHPMTGSWSATDGNSGNVVSGLITVSAVPIPATVWLFSSSLLGLVGLRKQ